MTEPRWSEEYLFELPTKRPEGGPGVCEMCGASEGVRLEDSRTAYAPESHSSWDRIIHLDDPLKDDFPDPNAPLWLCRDCAEEHHTYWNEMWDFVRSQG